MSTLEIRDLVASVAGKTILNGITLTVRSGEVHAVMGPNGAGKSTLSAVVMGKPGYEVISGSVLLDGVDMLSLPSWQRAQAGLHLVMQYPTEVPGVQLVDVMHHAFAARGMGTAGLDERLQAEALRIGFDAALFERALNVDLSGGEKKRNETLQVAMLEPKIVILDELDSGLDIDALRDCAQRIEALTNEQNLGVLAITHYNRLLEVLHPDHVHILVKGRIVSSGGAELADQLEVDGYAAFVSSDEEPSGGALADLFG
ncbi:MAG: Fe-S cluster assembly ATPase SufC [Ilumatobacteraceae bacterium]|nr:Fe-S cluster assembly ATPase SufC [Ilumatobacteraceae bacterium]